MKFVALLTIIFLIISCSAQRVVLSQNDRGCDSALYRYLPTVKNVAIVYGKIRTETRDNPAAAIFVNNNMYFTDSTGGIYKIALAPGNISYRLLPFLIM